MKKMLLATTALVMGMALASRAEAECNGLYLGLRSGVTMYDYSDKSDSIGFDDDKLGKNRFMLSGAIGYRYDYYRTELEYIWRDNSKWKMSFNGGGNSQSFKTRSIMWNHYVDFRPFSAWSPYLSAGLGFTKMQYNSFTYTAAQSYDNNEWFNHKPTRLTWALGGGVTVKVTNRINVDAGYRYYDIGSFGHEDVTLQEFYGGLRYVF